MAKQLYHPKAKEIDAFTFKVNVTSATVYPVSGILRIQLPLVSGKTYACWVDWGDGTAKQYINAYNSANSAHTYSTEGTYTIRIAGVCQGFYVNGSANTYSIKNTITEVVKWGTKADFRQLDFYNCTNLTKLPYDTNGMTAITGAASITTFANFVRGCTSLAQDLNDRLFSLCPSVTSFYYTFGSSAVQGTIPEDMFVEQSTNVTTFEGTFYDCNVSGVIPRYLFYTNTNVTTFQRTFYSSLVSGRVNAYLFEKNTKVQYFTETFGYTNVHGNIDPLLFSFAGASVLSFNGTFRNTNMGWDDSSSPTEVLPDDIWDTNINVTDFSFTLYVTKYNCTIPLCFTQNTKVTTFASHFSGTPFIGTIPVDLFVQAGDSVLSVNSTFNATSIQGIPDHLFWSNPNIWDFGGTFANCDNIGPSNNGLGYYPINNVLFSQNTKATNFGQTFWDSENIVQPLPPDLWANNPLVTSTWGCFAKVQIQYQVPSAIPVGIFANMPDLTNVSYFLYQGGYWMGNVQGEIPRDLFIYNTKLTNVEFFVRWRGGVTRIPNGLFRNNKLITNFYWFAQGAGNIKLERYVFSESNDVDAYEHFRGANISGTQALREAFFNATNGGRDYYLNLDVAPATDWVEDDVITGQTSGATCIVIAKISATQYEVKNNWGTWTLGEVVGVTGNASKLADQGTTRPTITSGAAAGTSYAPELWDGTKYDMYAEIADLRPRPSTLWQAGDTIVGLTSGASFVMMENQVTTRWTFAIKELTGTFQVGETVGVSGVPAKQITLASRTFTFNGRYITINVSPVTDWVLGDVITGQSSGATCIITSKISATQYYVRGMVGAFTDGEVIGVTGNANKLADQSAGSPVFGYAPLHTQMYYGGQNVMSNWADIPADWK